MKSFATTLATTGAVLLASTIVMAVSQAPLGSPLFFALVAAATTAYVVMMRRIWLEPAGSRRLLYTAFILAILFRVPLLIRQVGPDNDMVRYVWDGRVQRMGYNPYDVVPADP